MVAVVRSPRLKESMGVIMKADDVLKVFERLCADDLALEPDDAVIEFTSWLAERWADLDDEEIAVLTSVGATLFRQRWKQQGSRGAG